MKCECCGEEACGNFTWGLYDYTIPGTKEKIKRTEPMYNANLCKKCSDDLWNKIRGAVNAGYYHFTAKRL